MNRCSTSTAIMLAACLVASGNGCQEGREATYPVRGLVRFSDGKPVRFGTVEFRSAANGHIARGVVDQSGRFTLGTFAAADGAVAGTHQAIVVQLAPPEMLAQRPPSELAETEDHAGHEHTGLIAPQFSQYATTPLSVTVSPDESNLVELIVEPLRRRRPDRN